MLENLTLLYEAPILSVQLLIDGILIGAIFALAAYGMALVWGVMDIINIAQGEFVMLGGYVTFLLATGAGVHPLLTVPVAAAALFIFGWALYRLVVFRIVGKDMFISILATFGISILLQQLANELFGADVQTVESGLETLFFADDMITVEVTKLVAFGLALAVGGVLFLFLRQSRLGQAIRTWLIHPYLGLAYTLRSFMIVIVAGLGSIGGVIFASLGLGAAENFAGFILGTEYQAAFVFSLLVVILVWRNFRLSRQRKYLK
jgi:branched-chain amino acid transport system permease protein